jgi:Protein of unknown function (DUF1569)
MEVKNLFDAGVKQQIVERINKLTSQTPAQWGKMNVAQMLAHCQMPIGVAVGTHTIKSNPVKRLLLSLFKKVLWSEKPYKQGLPTDKSFITTGAEKDFTAEKHTLIETINKFTENSMVTTIHPAFGKLTKEQWSKACWKHLDHHLQQFGV